MKIHVFINHVEIFFKNTIISTRVSVHEIDRSRPTCCRCIMYHIGNERQHEWTSCERRATKQNYDKLLTRLLIYNTDEVRIDALECINNKITSILRYCDEIHEECVIYFKYTNRLLKEWTPCFLLNSNKIFISAWDQNHFPPSWTIYWVRHLLCEIRYCCHLTIFNYDEQHTGTVHQSALILFNLIWKKQQFSHRI